MEKANIGPSRQLIHKTLLVLDDLKVYKDPRFKTLIAMYEIVGEHPLYGKNTYWFFIFCENCEKDFNEYSYMLTTIKAKSKWLKKCTKLSITKFQLPNGFHRFFRGNGLDRERAIKADG